VLEGYSIFDFSQVPSLDMLIEVDRILGHRLKLDSITQATFDCEKTAEGIFGQPTHLPKPRERPAR